MHPFMQLKSALFAGAQAAANNGKKYAGRRALARALSVAAAVRHGVRVEDDVGGQRT